MVGPTTVYRKAGVQFPLTPPNRKLRLKLNRKFFMSKKYCSANCKEAYNNQLRMLKTGREFASFLPGYRLLGVDPGYLFVSLDPYNRCSIDLPEEIVDHLLKTIRAGSGGTAYTTDSKSVQPTGSNPVSPTTQT